MNPLDYTQGVNSAMDMYDNNRNCRHCGDSSRLHLVKAGYDGASDAPYNLVECKLAGCSCTYLLTDTLHQEKRFLPTEPTGIRLVFEAAKTKKAIDETVNPMKLTFDSAIAVVTSHNQLITELKKTIDELEARVVSAESNKDDCLSIIRALRQGSCNPEAPCDLVEEGAIGSYVCDYHA